MFAGQSKSARWGAAARFFLAILALAGIWSPLESRAEIVIGGKITDTQGAALSAARVEILPLLNRYRRGKLFLAVGSFDPKAAATTRADARGRFQLEAPEPGGWIVRVRASGFVPMVHRLAPLFDDVQLKPLRMRRDAGTLITLSRKDSDPLAAVGVRAATTTRAFWHSEEPWQPSLRMALTAEDGVVRLPRAEEELLELQIFAPGHREMRRNTAARLVARLEPVAVDQRSLKVRDATGLPAAGVLIFAGDALWPVGVTNEKGQISFQPPDDGRLVIELLTPHGGRERRVLPPSDAANATLPLELNLAPARHLSGRVVDARSREPVADAWAWLSNEVESAIRSGFDGSVSITLPAGFNDRALAGARVMLRTAASGYIGNGHTVILPISTDGRNVGDLALRPAAAVRGQAVTAFGKPLQDVLVTARQDSHELVTWTNAEGLFHLSPMVVGRRHTLELRKAGFASARLDLPPLEPFDLSNLSVVLSKGATILGEVVDADLLPVAGAEALLLPATDDIAHPLIDHQGGQGLRATCDGEGRFAVHRTPSGRLDLAVRKAGFAPLILRGITVPFEEDVLELGRLVLEPAATIRGQVIDRAKRPLADARVFVLRRQFVSQFNRWAYSDTQRPAAARTGSDGRFRIDSLPPGELVDLLVRLPGYAPAVVWGLTAPEPEEVLAVLQPASVVSGRVIDPEGQSLVRVMVYLRHQEDGSSRFANTSTRTDEMGRFIFEDIPPGTVRLAAHLAEYAVARVEDLKVIAGRNITNIEIRLGRGFLVEGEVLGPSGEPLAGAQVGFYPTGLLEVTDSMVSNLTTADKDGRYMLQGLASGRQRLFASHGRYPTVDLAIVVEPGSNHLDWILGRGDNVTGVLIDETGLPVEHASLQLIPVDLGRRFYSSTESDGSFLCRAVPPGEYRVQAEKPGYATTGLAKTVVIGGEPLAPLKVQLTQGAELIGRVLGLPMGQLASVEVIAERPGLRGERSGVDYQGGYRISHLSAGEWTLTARIPGTQSMAQTQIAIEPGTVEITLDLDFTAVLKLPPTH